MRRDTNSAFVIVPIAIIVLTFYSCVSKMLNRSTPFERMDCLNKLAYSSDSLKSLLAGDILDTSFRARRVREELGSPYLRLVTDSTDWRSLPEEWMEVFDERCLAGMHFNTFDSLFIRGVDQGYWLNKMNASGGNFSIWVFVKHYNNPVTFRNWYVIDDINWGPKYSKWSGY